MTTTDTGDVPDVVAGPAQPSTFTTSAWTSPSFWTSILTAALGVASGMAALFGHPIHNAVDNATLGAAAFLLAGVASAAITIARSVQKRAAIGAAAAVQAAHIDALARVAVGGGPHAELAERTLTRAAGAAAPAPAKTTTRRRGTP